jgi:hypothetical protein
MIGGGVLMASESKYGDEVKKDDCAKSLLRNQEIKEIKTSFFLGIFMFHC